MLAVATCLSAMSMPAAAGVLVQQQLATPLAPGMPDRLSIPMPAGFDAAQPVWVSYRVLAMSASPDPTGEIVLDGSFEGVMTPIHQSVVLFTPRDMTASTSGGTIKQQFEAQYGTRTAQEMQTALGDPLYQAYIAADAGTGRVLDGTLVKTLPPVGNPDAPLLISVERATGLQPVGLFVTVGQGEIPAEYGAGGSSASASASANGNAASVGRSPAYIFGRIAGGLLLLGIAYWFFIGRHKRG
jgi:hypothetical protein